MTYELRYRLMCGVNGSVQEGVERETIQAATDTEAVEAANRRLKERGEGTSVIPYAPFLCRVIAVSNPDHPPTAHSLRMIR